MSIVGPRPTLRYQVEQYTPLQRRRLEVRPGITGWAQVRGRNQLTWPRADRARRLVRRAPLGLARPAASSSAPLPMLAAGRRRLQRRARGLGRGGEAPPRRANVDEAPGRRRTTRARRRRGGRRGLGPRTYPARSTRRFPGQPTSRGLSSRAEGRAGTPPTRAPSGTSATTTAPAATSARAPTRTPSMTTAPMPTCAPSPTRRPAGERRPRRQVRVGADPAVVLHHGRPC